MVICLLTVMLMYCGLTVGWVKMKLGMEVGLGPGDIVLEGDPAPLPQRGTAPQFSAHVCSSQTAGWMKMPLGMEVGLHQDDIVLDGNPAPLKRARALPLFGPCLLWLNGWMDQDASWYGGRPRPRPHCVRLGPSSPPKRSTATPHLFGPCLLWPNSHLSQLLPSTCYITSLGISCQ